MCVHDVCQSIQHSDTQNMFWAIWLQDTNVNYFVINTLKVIILKINDFYKARLDCNLINIKNLVCQRLAQIILFWIY